MSGPLSMTPREVQLLGKALAEFTETTRTTGVIIGPLVDASLKVSDETDIEFTWDADAREYVLADRVGS